MCDSHICILLIVFFSFLCILYFYLLTRVIQTYKAQRGYMVSKSKLSNMKWTTIKVDYNCLFENQLCC